MEHVLLATDGSEYATKAADRAIDLAAERGSTLHVLSVVDRRKFDEPALSSDELATIEGEDRARECIESVIGLAEAAGVPAVHEHRHGIPQETILKYAEEVGAETIVIGEHGAHDDHCGGVGRRVAKSADREVIIAGTNTSLAH